jgi:Fe-S cluster biogenesis protein NfuA
MKMAVADEIRSVLDQEIRPGLRSDGGDVEFLGFDEKSGEVRVRLQGHCAGCPMSQMTVKGFVQQVLTKHFPGKVKSVRSV